MKRILLLTLSLTLLFSANAQLGGLLKKKKDKEQTAVTDTTAKPEQSEPEQKEKKKGGGFFQKVIGKVSKVAGNTVMSGSGITAVGDLAEADVIVSVGTNIYSKDLGLVVNDFLGKDWINNGDFTMLQIANKDAYQFYKYDGIIKVNGKELKHAGMGVHTATENPGTGNKKITFEKVGAIEGSFEVPLPTKNIKLISINGQTRDAKVDFTKDVVLEVANYSTETNSLIRVDVVGTIMGIRSLYCVGYLKPAAKITIPAAAFRNMETENKLNYKNCYLTISDQLLVNVVNPTGKIPPSQMAIIGSNDGKWIDVTDSKDIEKGFTLKTGNAVTVKRNAAFAKPLSMAKNVAVSSFYTYGTTYSYGESTNRWTQVETTKEIQFPEVPDEYLNAMLEDLYKKMTAAYSEVTGKTVLPAGTVPSLPAYANTQKFMRDEVNNDENFLKAYKNLEPTRTFNSVSNSYYGDGVMLKEAKADALLKVSLICQLSWDDKPKMTPYMAIELVGEANGDFRSFMGNTKYFTMNIKGDGYELKKKEPVEFNKVFQVDAFVSQFKKALQELKIKEQTMPDYETVWNLQK
ncbi:MAG: hypothetical protein KA428_08735 [Chitinophagaceae bacterium]|nr:hypothetical protein [Chitinophagaceae bacterium]